MWGASGFGRLGVFLVVRWRGLACFLLALLTGLVNGNVNERRQPFKSGTSRRQEKDSVSCIRILGGSLLRKLSALEVGSVSPEPYKP